MDENTWLGIEPISRDKHWHDTQRVCSPFMQSNLVCLHCYPKRAENSKLLMLWIMHLPFGEVMIVHTHKPARMAADLYAHVPVCVIFIAGQLWWMESCVALLGPLVSLRAEAGHLRMMHQAGGWRPGQSLCAYIVLLFMHVLTQNFWAFQKIFFSPFLLYPVAVKELEMQPWHYFLWSCIFSRDSRRCEVLIRVLIWATRTPSAAAR